MKRLLLYFLIYFALVVDGQQMTGQLQLPGGYTPLDVMNDPNVQVMASFAAATVSQSMNSVQPLTVFNILSAQSQVVAGVNYQLFLELQNQDNGGELIQCQVTVFDQSWTSIRQLIDCSCCPNSPATSAPTAVNSPVVFN